MDMFILGAADPEMAAIEKAIKDAGSQFSYAVNGGKRVTPATAYQADPVTIPDMVSRVVLVECEPREVVGCGQIVRVDHHRPGDPGYGMPPEKYWEASSLGQVCAIIGVEPSTELRIVAAADHSLEAAYRGRCPGVDPDELMRWRAESRAAFQKRPVEAVLADIEAAITALRRAPKVVIAGVEVADFGSTTVPELPEAAARVGMPFLATTVTPDGRRKVGLMAAPPEVVKVWMEAAPNSGLTGVYGDPARGFAGGYLP